MEELKIKSGKVFINNALAPKKRKNVIEAWNIAKNYHLIGTGSANWNSEDRAKGSYKPYRCFACDNPIANYEKYEHNVTKQTILIGENCHKRIIHFQFLIRQFKENNNS